MDSRLTRKAISGLPTAMRSPSSIRGERSSVRLPSRKVRAIALGATDSGVYTRRRKPQSINSGQTQMAHALTKTVTLLAAAGCAMAQLKSGAPAEVGISAERLARAAGLLKTEVGAGKVGAAAILVARDGRIVLHEGYGRLSREPGAATVRP